MRRITCLTPTEVALAKLNRPTANVPTTRSVPPAIPQAHAGKRTSSLSIKAAPRVAPPRVIRNLHRKAVSSLAPSNPLVHKLVFPEKWEKKAANPFVVRKGPTPTTATTVAHAIAAEKVVNNTIRQPVRREREDQSAEEDDDPLEKVLAARETKEKPSKTSCLLAGKLRELVIRYTQPPHPMSFAGTELTATLALTFPLTLMQRESVRVAVARHEWFINVEKFNFNNIEHRQMMMQFESIKPGTWTTYSSHWRRMMARGYRVNINALHEYMVNFRSEMGGHSMQSWISAVKLYSMIRYGEKPTELEDVKSSLLMRGQIRSENMYLAKRRPTGDLDVEQIIDVITRTDAPRHICDGLVLSHATGLRTMRVSDLRHKQVKVVYAPNGQDIACFCITLPRDKTNPANRDKMFVQHYTNPVWNFYMKTLWEEAVKAYDRTPIEKRSPEGAVFIEGWRGSRHNAELKKYAAELGWDPNLNWTTHSGKYGAAVEAGRRAAEEGKSAQEVANIIKATTGHLSYAMVAKYCEKREIKSVRGEAKAWLEQWIRDKADQTLPYEDFIRNGLKAKFSARRI